jgi:subtilisin
MLRLPFYSSILCILITVFGISCSYDEHLPPGTEQTDCTPVKSSRAGEIVEGRYIVSFNEESGRTKANTSVSGRVLSSLKIKEGNVIKRVSQDNEIYLLRADATQLDALRKNVHVASVEPDRIVSLCACFAVMSPDLVTWNVETTGYGDGTGTTAWVLDTGVEFDHPDLVIDKQRSKSFLDDVETANDDNGHGTHVAGVIGAVNNKIGTLGVASGASIIALKVLDKNGDGFLSAIIEALAWVRRYGKAGDVVNISLALDEPSDILQQEITKLATAGIYVTIAAGNDTDDAANFSPANINGTNIFTVSAIDSLNRFAKFSNYGNDVIDYAAPGVRVLSTYLGGRYAKMSGTSMAAPHVAGLLLINKGKINSAGFAIGDPDNVQDPIAHQ